MQKVSKETRISPKRMVAEYDVLRVTLMLLVVVGHCHYIRLTTDYGGIDYSNTFAAPSLVLRLVQLLSGAIYDFHMQCFMALSGALFFKSLHRANKGANGGLKELAMKKCRQLLVPFFGVSVLYSFPLKLISGYYAKSGNVLKDFVIGQIFLQGNTHLWFLEALFCAFIIVYLIEEKWQGYERIKLAFLFCVHLFSTVMPISAIVYPMQYTFWFYLGYCFEPHRERVNQASGIGSLSVSVALFVIIHIFMTAINLDALNIIVLAPMAAVLGSYATYTIAFLLSKTTIPDWKLFRCCLKNAFGIYLYSDPWNYVLLASCFSLWGSAIFTDNALSMALYILRFTFTLGVSILINMLVQRIKQKLRLQPRKKELD